MPTNKAWSIFGQALLVHPFKSFFKKDGYALKFELRIKVHPSC